MSNNNDYSQYSIISLTDNKIVLANDTGIVEIDNTDSYFTDVLQALSSGFISEDALRSIYKAHEPKPIICIEPEPELKPVEPSTSSFMSKLFSLIHWSHN